MKFHRLSKANKILFNPHFFKKIKFSIDGMFF